MTHQSIITYWQKEAEIARDRGFRFFRWLKTLDGKTVDRLAKATHVEVFDTVDCLQCTNCCRQGGVENPDDLPPCNLSVAASSICNIPGVQR